MPGKVVGFTIKIPLARETTDAQKALAKQRETVVGMQKKDLPGLSKATKDYLKTATSASKEAEQAAEKLGSTFSKSMETGLRGVNKFTTGLGKLKGELFNLKTALAGTAIGVGAIWAGRKLYEGGKQQLATVGRINREFGEDAATLSFQGRRTGRLSGTTEDDATKALIPFRERLDDIEAGAQFRGMRRPLDAKQASALRDRNLAFGSNLLARVSTLAPDVDQGEAGSVLADALSGPEGIRRLIGEFNLSKRSKTVAAANEKGEVYKFLRDDEKKQYGITKQGQYLEQGDLVNILLQRSGITEGAAEAKRKKLDFQIKAIGAEAENALADIGAKALEKFNGGMAKGATLSEKFENAIKSKEGQKVLEQVSTAVVDIAEGAVKVATTLPKIGSFLSEHKGTLLALGAAFVGIKGMSAVGGALGKLAGKESGGLLGGLGAKPIPVYVVNEPLPGGPGGAAGKLGKLGGFLGAASSVLAAGAAGYALGTAADEWLGISDKIGSLGARGDTTGKSERSVASVIATRVNAGKETGAQAAQELERFAKSAEGKANAGELSPAVRAIIEAFKNTPTVINLDGQKVAEVVSKHQGKAVDVAGARGAAPYHRE